MKGNIERLTYILFIISNFLMLFNPGVYWDDWVIFNMDEEGIMNQFYGNGVIPVGYLHVFLKRIWTSPILYQILTFILQLIQVYTLFLIAKKYPLKKRYSKFIFFSILLFAVFPHYDSKITMIVFPYTLCLTLFLLAIYWLLRFFYENNQFYRVLSLIFFFLSFFTNSLLFFYMVPVFCVFFLDKTKILWRNRFKGKSLFLKEIFRGIVQNLDFFILPFLFWFIRLKFFMPSGQYEKIGYNEVKIESLGQIPFRYVKFGYAFFVDLVPHVLKAVQIIELVIITFMIIWLLFRHLKRYDLSLKLSWREILIGVLLVMLGAFPYLMVNKFPTHAFYLTRHQLLLGFGLSISITAIIFLFTSFLVKRLLLAFSLGCFIGFNLYTNFSYFKGYVKQQAFHQYFEESNLKSETPRTIYIEDHTRNFTLKGNPVKFYAFGGILKKSNPEENILLISKEDLLKYEKQNLFTFISPYFKQYNLSNYEITEADAVLEIKYSEKKQSTFPFISFYTDFFTGKKERWNEYFDFELKDLEEEKS